MELVYFAVLALFVSVLVTASPCMYISSISLNLHLLRLKLQALKISPSSLYRQHQQTCPGTSSMLPIVEVHSARLWKQCLHSRQLLQTLSACLRLAHMTKAHPLTTPYCSQRQSVVFAHEPTTRFLLKSTTQSAQICSQTLLSPMQVLVSDDWCPLWMIQVSFLGRS